MIASTNQFKFKDYMDKLCKEGWSSVKSLTIEDYQGRPHYKLVTQMMWYRTRYYVKLPLIMLPKDEYAHSQFFTTYAVQHDEVE